MEEWDSIDRKKAAGVAAKRPKDNGDKSSYRRSDSDAKKEKKVPVAQDELASTHTLDPSPIDTAPNQYYVLEEVHNVTPLLWAINLPLLP